MGLLPSSQGPRDSNMGTYGFHGYYLLCHLLRRAMELWIVPQGIVGSAVQGPSPTSDDAVCVCV